MIVDHRERLPLKKRQNGTQKKLEKMRQKHENVEQKHDKMGSPPLASGIRMIDQLSLCFRGGTLVSQLWPPQARSPGGRRCQCRYVRRSHEIQNSFWVRMHMSDTDERDDLQNFQFPPTTTTTAAEIGGRRNSLGRSTRGRALFGLAFLKRQLDRSL